jgi:predicted DNA-binding transcriptional regulator AlpA
MHLYKIKEHEVPLFTIRYVKAAFGTSKSAVNRKIERGQLPPANFYGANNLRLYSIEDLAVIEYIYKEVWPYKQGVKIPEWVKDLAADALALSKGVVVQYGKSQEADDWLGLDRKYPKFSRFRLQIYIDSWRRRLLDVDEFFPELVDDNDDW